MERNESKLQELEGAFQERALSVHDVAMGCSSGRAAALGELIKALG